MSESVPAPLLEWIVESTDMVVEVRIRRASSLGEAKDIAIELFERAIRARRR